MPEIHKGGCSGKWAWKIWQGQTLRRSHMKRLCLHPRSNRKVLRGVKQGLTHSDSCFEFMVGTAWKWMKGSRWKWWALRRLLWKGLWRLMNGMVVQEDEGKRMNSELLGGQSGRSFWLIRCRIECDKVPRSTSGFLACIIGCLVEPIDWDRVHWKRRWF